MTSACDLRRAPVLDPKGPIALAERDLLFDAFYVMMLVIVPIIILTLWFAWKYRATNTEAKYTPTWANSVKLDAITWLIPTVIVIAVAVLLWRSTHRLDPYRPLESKEPPFDVQVVAQDWKWLFIYPEQGIAVVNQLAFPAGRPVSLRITSDTVMNSFYVPQLAGQIYAMAGMQTRLQMLADQPGKFVGRNSQYSGGGYSDQHFEVLAMTPADFEAWVARAKQSGAALDANAYTALAAKSRANPITYYSTVEPKLFDSIIDKFRHSGHAHDAPARR
ncbi:ubiquinol oxidase subunit II [Reyranella sp. MMS21-HV4-11]|uniref:Ubiquinol oxidase subunit 2 n=1 Tax=Reyranella humidisoli TaxID=2849149 RepID=A0ABS6IEH2_9HYPH|nr:ubiquinol oxidase subunit II [Reyranella sp. MMS21-HV4-11]